MHWLKKTVAVAAAGLGGMSAMGQEPARYDAVVPAVRLGTPTALPDSGVVRAFTPITPPKTSVRPASFGTPPRPLVVRGAGPLLDDEPTEQFLPKELPPLDEARLIWPTPPETAKKTEAGATSVQPASDLTRIVGSNAEAATVVAADTPISTSSGIVCADGSCDSPFSRYDFGPGRFYAKGEWLLWWTRGFRLPPLVATDSPNAPIDTRGLLGNGTAQLIYGNSLTSQGPTSGARFTVGYNVDPCGFCALEANFFFLGRKNDNASFSSAQNPVLSRPFFDLNNGTPNRELLSSPDQGPGTIFAGNGSIRVDTSSTLLGGELNLRRVMTCGCSPVKLTALAGFRALSLSENLRITESTLFLTDIPYNFPDVPVFAGDRSTLFDSFSTRNRFFGGQIGAAAEWQRERWSFEARAKLAIGATYQAVDVDGGVTLASPGRGTQTFVGGLYAVPSNMGTHSQTRFGLVPEVGFSVGYQLTENIRVFAGYDFLYWSSVVRPGDQVDQVLDLNQVPQSGRPYPPANQVRPRVPLQTSSYWAQGINAGLLFRY